jgi:hypothetical protein
MGTSSRRDRDRRRSSSNRTARDWIEPNRDQHRPELSRVPDNTAVRRFERRVVRTGGSRHRGSSFITQIALTTVAAWSRTINKTSLKI